MTIPFNNLSHLSQSHFSSLSGESADRILSPIGADYMGSQRLKHHTSFLDYPYFLDVPSIFGVGTHHEKAAHCWDIYLNKNIVPGVQKGYLY